MAEVRHVRHNPDTRRYELVDSDGHVLGHADYYIDGDVVVVPHTEVVRHRRGDGLGAELVQGVLDDVRARGTLVRPRCWYVAEFIGEHPEYQDVVTD